MTKSEEIKNLAKALMMFHATVEPVKKEGTNPHFKSKYAELPDVLKAIKSPLAGAGLVITQLPDTEGLVTMVIHIESGEFISTTTPIVFEGQNPQKQKSAYTYMRRTALLAILGLEEEDDDGQTASQGTLPKVYNTTTQTNLGNCGKCGKPNALSKTTGKPYCSAKCWLNPEPAVQADDAPFPDDMF